MIRSTQKRHLLALLTVVLALFALLLMHPTAGAADDGSDKLVGANIKDGVLLGYYGLGGDIVLPNTVTKIGDEALKGNDNIVSITIPGSVKDIGNNAFEGCTKLERVIFTNPGQASGNLIIRVSAFQDCKKLTECEIPARAYQVVGNIFKVCTSLTEVKVNAANPYYFTQDGVLFARLWRSINPSTTMPMRCNPIPQAAKGHILSLPKSMVRRSTRSGPVALRARPA